MKRLVCLFLFAFLLVGTGFSALAVTLNQSSYLPGETVNFTVSGGSAGEKATVIVIYPNMSSFGLQDVLLDAGGSNSSLSASALLALAVNGTWTVSANTSTGGPVSTTFTVPVQWANPTVSLNSSSVTVLRSATGSALFSITNNLNTNDTLLVNYTGCDGINLTCSLNQTSVALNPGETKAVLLTANVSASATAGTYSVVLRANNSLNATNTASTTLSVTVPSPVGLAIVSALVYDKSAENLTLNISSITKENVTGEILPVILNFTLRNNAGTVLNSTASATKNTVYSFSTSGWLPGNYTMTIYANDSDGNFGNSTVSFAIFRATQIAASAPASSPQNSSFTISITSKSNAGTALSWLITAVGGITCTPASGTAASAQCNISSSLSTGVYAIIVSQSVTSCLTGTNPTSVTCTVTPAISNSTAFNFTVTAPSSQQQQNQNNTNNQQNNNSQNEPAQEQPNMVGPLRITIPSTVDVSANNFVVKIENTDVAITKSVVLAVEETGEYVHFNISNTAISSVANSGSSDVTVSINPLPYMKPGTYTFSVTINGKQFTTSKTIPAPADNKSVYRYLDVKKDRSSSLVTLYVKNTGNFTKLMVIENISKDVAANASEIIFASAQNYTIFNNDPLIGWLVDFTDSNESVIQYTVNKDLSAASFNEPTTADVSEGKKQQPQIGEIFSDPLAVAFMAVIIISAGAGFTYFHFIKSKKDGIAHEKAIKRLGVRGPSGKPPSIFKLELQKFAFNLGGLGDKIKTILLRKGGKEGKKEAEKPKKEANKQAAPKQGGEESVSVDDLKKQMAELQRKMQLLEKNKK